MLFRNIFGEKKLKIDKNGKRLTCVCVSTFKILQMASIWSACLLISSNWVTPKLLWTQCSNSIYRILYNRTVSGLERGGAVGAPNSGQELGPEVGPEVKFVWGEILVIVYLVTWPRSINNLETRLLTWKYR